MGYWLPRLRYYLCHVTWLDLRLNLLRSLFSCVSGPALQLLVLPF